MHDFERNFNLTELLPKRSFARIKKALEQMGMNSFQIVDIDNRAILESGREHSDLMRIELSPELEPVGYLMFQADKMELAESAVNFLVELMQTNWRYQMASNIHLQVSQQDYQDLKEQHQLLTESEKKYKELSEHLEERVDCQLKQIEDSQRQLYEAEKMASVGQLAAGVAHEINNPIGFISSNLNAAKEYIDDLYTLFEKFQAVPELSSRCDYDPQEVQEIFTDFNSLLLESSDGAKRVSTIVSDLKAFSNIDQSELASICLSESIEQVARVFLTSVGNRVNLKTDIAPLHKTLCKPAHINQLLLNLLHNAAEAVTDDQEIILGCRMEGEKISLTVEDKGIGMDEETLKKAFEPFYTTHEVGAGTGLGLTVSRDIVKAHGGEIIVTSQINQGTKVKILLPVNTEHS